MNVLMVYPKFPDTFWSFRYALKFVNKKINNPPLGLMTVAALLPADWNKKLIDMNIHPLKDSDIQKADFVMISAMNVQSESVDQIIKMVNKAHKPIIAGGPLFSCEPERFPNLDSIVIGEAEECIADLIEDMQSGKGLQRRYQGHGFPDLSTSPLPDISLIDFKEYESMCIQFSRGCPYQCDFCNVTSLYGHTPRCKTKQQIVAELDQFYAAGWRRNIFFVDDNFIGNKGLLKKEILPALIDWRKEKNGCEFITEASINLSDDDELMESMVAAGFKDVFIGIETPDENSLLECNKKQNSKRSLLDSVHRIQSKGMQVMAGFIVGFDHDSSDIFDRMITFIQQSGIVTAMVGLLQAPTGTELFRRLEREDRILRYMSGDNADGTTNIRTIMGADQLREGYFKIIETIYSPAMLYPRIKTFLRNYKPVTRKAHLQSVDLAAFVKTLFRMGLFSSESRFYWDLIFWTLRDDFRKFPMAITMVIYGYHFRKITGQTLTVS